MKLISALIDTLLVLDVNFYAVNYILSVISIYSSLTPFFLFSVSKQYIKSRRLLVLTLSHDGGCSVWNRTHTLVLRVTQSTQPWTQPLLALFHFGEYASMYVICSTHLKLMCTWQTEYMLRGWAVRTTSKSSESFTHTLNHSLVSRISRCAKFLIHVLTTRDFLMRCQPKPQIHNLQTCRSRSFEDISIMTWLKPVLWTTVVLTNEMQIKQDSYNHVAV